MIYHTRKLVKPEDLNAGGSLFGGSLLRWIDEEAAIYVMCQLDSKNVVTKFMSEINFVSPAQTGDVVEIGLETIKFGKSSIKNEVHRKDLNLLLQPMVHPLIHVALNFFVILLHSINI